MSKKILVAVAWPYVNGDLHIGHLAGYLLPADIFARFQRLKGNEVLMVSGSDCYGTPITVEAEKRTITPQEVVDLYHPHHLKLFEQYGISFDLFTKTATKNHNTIVQDMLVAMAKNGYIYKDTTQQYYGEKERKFLPDRYVEGICPYCEYEGARGDQCDGCGRVLESGQLKSPISKLSGSSVVLKNTDHLFVNWPKLGEFLKLYTVKAGKKWKKWVNSETYGWLEKGLKPRAITRDIHWGVPIPNSRLPEDIQLSDATTKRIYVWFDAVVGYLSASVEWAKNTNKWKDFWYPDSKNPASHYYFMGKDNLVFHTLFWPGQLHGYDKKIHMPDVVSVNQFLNFGGEKFSKSRNVVIDSAEIGKKYGVDSVRFYLTYVMPEQADSSFSWEDYYRFHNTVLIGTFANYINRVLTLAKGVTVGTAETETIRSIDTFLSSLAEHAEKCEFKMYAQRIIEFSQEGNKYIDTTSPWKLEKTSEQYAQVITNGIARVIALTLAMTPIIPHTSKTMVHMLGISLHTWDSQTDRFLGELLKQVTLRDIAPLFSKIEHKTEV